MPLNEGWKHDLLLSNSAHESLISSIWNSPLGCVYKASPTALSQTLHTLMHTGV